MAIVKFNKRYDDYELDRIVEADEEVEMTVKRADEIVKNITVAAGKDEKLAEYADFSYERLDEQDKKEEVKPDKKEEVKKDDEADK